MKEVLKLKFRVFTILLISSVLSFGSEIKLLKKDFLDTDIGTVKDKKLVKKLPIVKKDEKKLIVKSEKKETKSKKRAVKKIRNITVYEKKENFKKILVPIVVSVYNELELKYKKIRNDIHMGTNLETIELLKKEYKAKSEQELLHAIKPHPVSIVLAQSAIESAWLTSRFAKEANNIFGVWSFKKSEPRIAANGLRGEKTIYLKKYDSLTHAVRDYYKSIAKSWAYVQFRYLRTMTEDPFVLLPHLKAYSEKREVYTDTLAKMIKSNGFDKYDVKKLQ